MKTYIALQPVDLQYIDKNDIDESLAEFGCHQRVIDGNHYMCCGNLDALAQMMSNLDLPGSIIEVTAIYESKEETTTMEVGE